MTGESPWTHHMNYTDAAATAITTSRERKQEEGQNCQGGPLSKTEKVISAINKDNLVALLSQQQQLHETCTAAYSAATHQHFSASSATFLLNAMKVPSSSGLVDLATRISR